MHLVGRFCSPDFLLGSDSCFFSDDGLSEEFNRKFTLRKGPKVGNNPMRAHTGHPRAFAAAAATANAATTFGVTARSLTRSARRKPTSTVRRWQSLSWPGRCASAALAGWSILRPHLR